MKISIQAFAAQFPRVHPTRLNDNAAAIAQNVELGSGVLKPIHGSAYALTLPAFGAEIKDAYLWVINNMPYWLQFRDRVDVIRSPIADDTYRRIYWTGDSRDADGNALFAYTPSIYTGGMTYPVVSYKLGIPAPTHVMTIVSHSDTSTELSEESRSYVYTYVNEIGEESAPSPPSAQVVTHHQSSTVTIGELLVDTSASTGRVLMYKRIYRSATDTAGDAVFRFVDQIPIAQSTYTDTKRGTELSEVIATIGWDAPRLNMKGLGLTGYGVAYAFTGKIVCLSEPFIVYAFPREYELTTQYDIVAMGHYDSFLIVGTTGNPVVISGIDPANMSMLELPINEACVSAKSMVSMGHSAVYASPNGLVVCSGSSANLATESIFGVDEWAALNPSSIHAVEHRGRYLFFWKQSDTVKGGFIFDPRNPSGGVIRIDTWCKSTHRDIDTDTLYLLQDDGVLQRFDSAQDPITPFVWRSKLFSQPMPKRFLAAQVIADSYTPPSVGGMPYPIIFRVYADGQLLHTHTPVNYRGFRIPNHSERKTWQIEVQSAVPVREIMLASMMHDLLN
jgi:hypothetical protein